MEEFSNIALAEFDAQTRFKALAPVENEAEGIITAKLDHRAHNTRDVLELVDDVLWPANKALILLDLQVDTTTAQGYMILTVMSAVARKSLMSILKVAVK